MIDALITYLPFYRIHEVEDYFLKNVEVIGVRRAVVYVDNVYTDRQKAVLSKVLPSGVEVVPGNWRDRNTCFLTIIRDAIEHGDNALVVDSDNEVWPDLQMIDDQLISSYGFYTILNNEAAGLLASPRVMNLGVVSVNGREVRVYGYKIVGLTKGIYFIGPKQGVRLSPWLLKHIDVDFLNKLMNALQRVEPSIRNYISDEITLGILLYYSGIGVTPFIVWSHHRYHGSMRGTERPIIKTLVATAHARLGRELVRIKRDRRALWYFARYKLAQLLNGVYALLK
ncbi:MAG: hypothetical protein TU36_005125 [Vulcanisaeta sp. AZ3]